MRNGKVLAFAFGLACFALFAVPATSDAQKGGGGRGGGGGMSMGRVGGGGPAHPPSMGPPGGGGFYGNRIGYGGVYLGLGGYGLGGYGLGGFGYPLGGYGYGFGNYGIPGYYYNSPGIVYSQPLTSGAYLPVAPPSAVSPTPSNNGERGTVVVIVPDGAELFWGGWRSDLPGTTRTYSTLPLAPEGAMQMFEARWTGADGKAVTQTRAIRAMPNTTVVLDFTKANVTMKEP